MDFQTSIDFEAAALAKDQDQMSKLILQVANEHGARSRQLSELTSIAAGYNLPYEGLYELYLEQNPEIIHPAQVTLAALYADTGRIDQSSELARDYVRKLLDSSLAEQLTPKTYLSHVLGRGFLLTTAIYTEVGARSYSLRVLERALKSPISDVMQGHIANEVANLKRELGEPANAELDQKWEKFFSSGAGFDELYKLCTDRGFSKFAKRIELLEGQFRFQLGWKADEKEMLLTTHVIDTNTYLLN